MISHSEAARAATAVGIALLLLVALSPVTGVTPAAAAGGFTADDVSVELGGGESLSVTVAPAGTATYDGFDQVPSSSSVAVQVLVDGQWETVGSQSLGVTDLEGAAEFDFDPIDIVVESGFGEDEFLPGGWGETVTTTVALRLQVTFAGVDGGDDLVVTSQSSFDVEVTAPEDDKGGGQPPWAGGGP